MVISAAPRTPVAILEEGQLVEFTSSREKEFALVGSIYRAAYRVIPGMQSGVVDLGWTATPFCTYDFRKTSRIRSRSWSTDASGIADSAGRCLAELAGESLANAHSSDEPAPLSADDEAQQAIPHEEPLHADSRTSINTMSPWCRATAEVSRREIARLKPNLKNANRIERFRPTKLWPVQSHAEIFAS